MIHFGSVASCPAYKSEVIWLKSFLVRSFIRIAYFHYRLLDDPHRSLGHMATSVFLASSISSYFKAT